MCVCVCVCVIERGLCLRGEGQKKGVCMVVTNLFVMGKVSVKRVRDHWGECVECEGSNYNSLVCQDLGCLMLCVCVCVCVCDWTGEPGTEGEWTVCVCRRPGGGCPRGPREERDSEGKWL